MKINLIYDAIFLTFYYPEDLIANTQRLVPYNSIIKAIPIFKSKRDLLVGNSKLRQKKKVYNG